jgi:hypothetical protein
LAYDQLIRKSQNYSGSVGFENREEFLLQAAADVIGEILAFNYVMPLLKLDSPSIKVLYA